MLHTAADRWTIDLARSFIVGDRWRDIGAGEAAGCKTLLIDCGYKERSNVRPDHTVADLGTAAEIILELVVSEEREVRKDHEKT